MRFQNHYLIRYLGRLIKALACGFFLLFTGGINSGFSQVIKPASPMDSLEEIRFREVEIIKIQRDQEMKKTAAAVSAVKINTDGSTSLTILPLFSQAAGVFPQEGTFSTSKITLRGVGSRYPYGTKKIKAFLGDLPLYSAEGETSLDDINPEYLSNIEVIKGPASGIYGASLGGVVLLTPKSANYQSFGVNSANTIGSFGYRNHSLDLQLSEGKNSLIAGYTLSHSDGYRENNSYNRNSLFLHQKHLFGKNFTGTFTLIGSSIRAGIPSSVDSLTLFSNPEKAATTWLKTKGYEHPDRFLAGYKLSYYGSKRWTIATSIFYGYHKTEENRPFNFLEELGNLYGTRSVINYTRPIHQAMLRITAGTNLFYEKLRSELDENIGGLGVKGIQQQLGKEFLYQTDFFAQAELTAGAFIFTGGLNLNYSGLEYRDIFSMDTVDQSGDCRYKPVFSPRFSILWNPVPLVNIFLAANHGFSVPSLSETLSPLGLINQSIKPEKAMSLEGGLKLGSPDGRFFTDVSVYRMLVSNLIVPKRIDDDVYVGMNAGSTLHQGIEFTIHYQLAGIKKPENNHFYALTEFSGAVNQFKFKEFVDEGNDYSGKKIPGMPDQNFSVRLEAGFKQFFLEGSLLSVGGIPLNDANSKYSKSYSTLNFKAGYVYNRFSKIKITGNLVVNNLTDERYASMVVVNAPVSGGKPPRYYYPAMPRWFRATLLVSFKDPMNKLP